MLTLALLPLIKYLGYPGIFLVVFMESGVPFGFFLPGSSFLFTAGLLASQGYFNPWILIPLVALAAILGDNAGYWFGAKVGRKLFERPDSRFFKQEHLRQAHDFYERYGSKVIFVARFVPIVRTFAPIIGGIAGMTYRTFLAYNVLGAITWASGVTAAGYFLGREFPLVQEYLTFIILGIIVVTTAPVFWKIYKSAREDNRAIPPQSPPTSPSFE